MRSIQSLLSLQGRVALVAGGAGHIGMAICEALAEAGAAIAVLDREAEQCALSADTIHQCHQVPTMGISVDLADEEATRAAPHEVVRHLGRLDILVHSAAWTGSSQIEGWAVPFDRQTIAAWNLALQVNLTSAFTLAQEASPFLTSSHHGAIILISSIYGLVGPDMSLYESTSMANPAGYGASKGGIIQLTRYLATILAPAVRVNTISPGGVWRNQPSVFQQRYEARAPLGRMALEEDIKGAAVYLASDLSAYVTGHNLVVDGGWTAW